MDVSPAVDWVVVDCFTVEVAVVVETFLAVVVVALAVVVVTFFGVSW